MEIKVQRAVRDLNDPSLDVQIAGWQALRDLSSGQRSQLMDLVASQSDLSARQSMLDAIVWVASTYAELARELGHTKLTTGRRQACQDGLPLLDAKTRNIVAKHLSTEIGHSRMSSQERLADEAKRWISAVRELQSEAKNTEEFAMAWATLGRLDETVAISTLEKTAKKVDDPRPVHRAIHELMRYFPNRALRVALHLFQNNPTQAAWEAAG